MQLVDFTLYPCWGEMERYGISLVSGVPRDVYDEASDGSSGALERWLNHDLRDSQCAKQVFIPSFCVYVYTFKER